jgi:hypothetical protein
VCVDLRQFRRTAGNNADTGVSYEEEDTCVSYEEEDTCVSVSATEEDNAEKRLLSMRTCLN